MTEPRGLRIARIATGSIMVLFGAMKFMMADMQMESFENWGYPSWMAFVVGATELTAGGLLLARKLQFWAAGAVAVVMAGAIIAHLRIPEVGLLPLAVVLLATSSWIGWVNRPAWLLTR